MPPRTGWDCRTRTRKGPADANAYFKANTAKHRDVGVLDSVALDGEKGEVQAKAHGTMLASLLKAVGIKHIGFNNQATVRKGKGTVEVALVLDNSGSMGGQPIADLRTAAQNLVSVLYTGYEGTDKVKVGVVPFAAAVNVGPQYKTAAWMDTTGASPVHFENFDQPKTRFELLAADGRSLGRLRRGAPGPARRHRQRADGRHSGEPVRADVQPGRARPCQ